MISNFSQFPLKEVQKNEVLVQLSHITSSAKLPPTNDLRKLLEELRHLSSRAKERAHLLEQSQAHLKRNSQAKWRNDSDEDSTILSGNTKNGPLLTKEPTTPRISRISSTQSFQDKKRHYDGSDDSSSVKVSRRGTQQSSALASPSTNHSANKRTKDNQPKQQDSNANSTSTTSSNSTIGSVKGSGNGKHFESHEKVPHTQPKVKHSAGPLVQDDFSRVKITNQVPIQTFWTSLEPYFRHITDDDIAYLERASNDQESYIIPKLGKFYPYVWTEEEVSHFPDHMHNNKTRYHVKQLLKPETNPKIPPEKSFPSSELKDSDLVQNTARLAPLTERIVSALIGENIILEDGTMSAKSESVVTDSLSCSLPDDNNDIVPDLNQEMSSPDNISLEERLKQELRYIGILDDIDVNWTDREDDEVCVQLRALQRQLREQVALNNTRKLRLLPIAKDHIGYQEYIQVIDELDKQVEQSYLKRHRLTKSRKRKSTPTKSVALSDNTINAMDRRRRVIQAIGHLFPTEKFALPKDSIFEGIGGNPKIEISNSK